jgi:hypothetical protein
LDRLRVGILFGSRSVNLVIAEFLALPVVCLIFLAAFFAAPSFSWRRADYPHPVDD